MFLGKGRPNEGFTRVPHLKVHMNQDLDHELVSVNICREKQAGYIQNSLINFIHLKYYTLVWLEWKDGIFN